MGDIRKLQSRVVSFLLSLVMTFSSISIPIANAAGNYDITQTKPGVSNKVDPNTNWNSGLSFIRATILFAENSNWKDGKVYQVGKTIDLFEAGNAPSNVVWCSNRDNISNRTEFQSICAPSYNAGEPIQFGWYRYEYDKDYFGAYPIPVGLTKEEAEANRAKGVTMDFPTLIGSRANGVDVKTYFKQYMALGELLWRSHVASGGASPVLTTDIQNGVYKDDIGNTIYGQYIIVLEPGLYAKIAGNMSAITLREAILLDDLGFGLSTNLSSAVPAIGKALTIEKWWPMINLNGTYSMEDGYLWDTIENNRQYVLDKYGVGIIEFSAVEKDPIPVVNYYYDLDEEDFTRVGLKIKYETDEKTGEKTAKVVDSEGNQITTEDLIYEYGEIFDVKADNAKKVNNNKDVYNAPADDGEYQLISGYMTNKKVIAGNLDIKNGGLGFYDISGKANITEQLKNHTGIADLSEEKVKEWYTSQNFATTVLSNQAVSGLSKLRHIEQDTDGGLTASFGNGIDSLQAVFLYIKSSVPILPPPTITIDDDTDITIVVKNRKTTVTKMYYDSEDAEEPSEVVTDKISIFDTYQVKDEELDGESYKMVEWVMVPDETDGEAEGYKTWEEVKEHQAEGKDNN